MSFTDANLPPLKSLQVFESVARYQSVTQAAQELNVTQSAVSHQIRNLEDFLQTRLFDRNGPKLSLSDDGHLLYHDLSQAITLIKHSVGALRAAHQPETIGVTVRSHFAMNWLSRRVVELSTLYPDLNLHFNHSNTPADFSDPSIHASIEWRRIDEVQAHMRLLFCGNLTPACHPDLLHTPGLKIPADLAHHTLLHESDESVWWEWLRLAGVPRIQPKRKVFYEDTNVRQQSAVAGAGVALVCPELVADDLAAGRLVLPFDIVLDTWSYYLIIPPDRLMIPNVRRFANWIESEASASTLV